MKKTAYIFSLLATLSSAILFSCTQEEVIVPEITVPEGSKNYFTEVIEFSALGGSETINFTSNVNWAIGIAATEESADWCSLSQNEGSKGTYGIIVTTNENNGYDDRSVTFVLTAGDISKNIVVNQKQKNAIEIATKRFEVGTEGGQISIEVNANVDYEIEIPEAFQTWISQKSKTRGLTGSKFSFVIAESKEYDKREGEILITSGEITETVKIYQAGSAILVLSQNEYTMGSEGGVISIDISSNFHYEVDMPNVNWVKPMTQTRAVSNYTLKYEITPNTTYDDREAVIVFKDTNSDKKESVTIKQRQQDAILLSNKKVEIPQAGGSFSVDVNSNVNYEIEIPGECQSWISNIPQTRALTTNSLSFNVAESEEYDKREGEIIFKYNDIVDTLKVYQSGGAILVLTQSEYNLEGRAATITIELKSNLSYTVSTSADWITSAYTRAVSSSSKTFNISMNDTGEIREGTITFTTSDNSKSATVHIAQAPIVRAESLSVSFYNNSGTIGGDLYIGAYYDFYVTTYPSNATTDFEWRVEDTNIASITNYGNSARMSTIDFGKSKVIVTEKNSGVTSTFDFSTAVTNFRFNESSRETQYGYPVITIAIDGSHQIKYSCSPSYATKVFQDLNAFNFKEINTSINSFVIVDESSVINIDENGLITPKKIGTTIIQANNSNGVYKSGSDDGIFINVVEEITPYGTIGGHGYVDLALPSGALWSTCNYGTSSETDYGTYCMWSSNDMVPSYWGSRWSTPLKDDFNELLSYCSYEWTTKNGTYGYLFTGSNGATMFLPAAGFKTYIDGYGLYGPQSAGSQIMYWSLTESSYSWEGQSFAYALDGSSNSLSSYNTYNTTKMAFPIRPISK